jgi:hypothetical protein
MFDSNGHYWRVGDRIFYSKAMAVEYASRTGKQLHFNYFNNFYNTIDWATEPTESLQQLYKRRAEQLLSKYDHVALLLSGGSDSTAVVNTFIRNGLMPSEVISYQMLNKVMDEKSTTNIEVTLSASKIAKACQDVGIPYRIINLWDNINNVKYDDKFFETADTRMCIDNLIKIEGLHKDRKLLDLVSAGKKVCLVNGLEKPRVFIKDGYWTTAHLDGPLASNFWGRDLADNHGVFTERFFTTTDMPAINVKQCHVIIQHYEQNVPDYRNLLIHTNDFDFQKYYRVLNDILFDGIWKNDELFSLGKLGALQKYIVFEKLMAETKMVKEYQGLIKDFYNSIDKDRFINFHGKLGGYFPENQLAYPDLKGNYGDFYRIKKVSDD